MTGETKVREENDLTRIKLRRYESILIVSGGGIIAFGVWMIIKMMLSITIDPLDISMFLSSEHMADIEAHGIYDIVNTVFLVMVLVFSSLDMLLRIYVGRSAITDGRATKKKTVIFLISCYLYITLFNRLHWRLLHFIISGIYNKNIRCKEVCLLLFFS